MRHSIHSKLCRTSNGTIYHMQRTQKHIPSSKLLLRMLSSRMCCHVVWYKLTHISDEHSTSIFMVEKCHATTTTFTISLSLNMDSIHSSETSVNSYQTARCHSPKNNTLHSDCCQNLKSNTKFYISKNCSVQPQEQ
jgi:hypothetical protein